MPTKTKYAVSSIDWNKVREDERKARSLAAKAKVREDGKGYKVRLSGKEYSADECGSPSYTTPPIIFDAIKKAVKKYESKRIGLKRDGEYWWFNDSDGRGCCYRQSSLADKDTVWFGLDSGHDIHLSESKNSALAEALYDIIDGSRRSFTGTDYYGSKYSVTADNGGFVLTIKTDMNKKRLTRKNTMRFDARAARVVSSIVEDFTDFNDDPLGK
jgi:hypothetical protein